MKRTKKSTMIKIELAAYYPFNPSIFINSSIKTSAPFLENDISALNKKKIPIS